MRSCYLCAVALALFALYIGPAHAQGARQPRDPANDSPTARGDAMLKAYFAGESRKPARTYLSYAGDPEAMEQRKQEARLQLFYMLGLDPLPERTPLDAVTTGTITHEEFVVENLHFQSSPKLYVTGNLYIPKSLKAGEKAPAVLYLCGHHPVKKNGVSYGNKVFFQDHGAWFARHGYVCLVIDTLQMGEIEGLHHGMYREGRWWWASRGYTPAGVEAWNGIRALDYLQSRPEVDGERIGVTGRSGGGATSWWLAALDERIQAAVPVAGITDLRNHVVDGIVEGHCDCMFFHNIYRWDFHHVPALVAPRPLVLSNTDRDSIFPLDGVLRIFQSTKRVYERFDASEKFALNITAGGHLDSQELQMQAIRWFDQHLMKTDRKIDKAAVSFFEPEQLRVFDKLPEDQINTKIDELFVPAASSPEIPADKAAWKEQSDAWRANLRERVFRQWPSDYQMRDQPANTFTQSDRDVQTRPPRQGLVTNNGKLELRPFGFTSQALAASGAFQGEFSAGYAISLDLFVLSKPGLVLPETVVVHVLDEPAWQEFLAKVGHKFEDTFPNVKLPPVDEAGYRELEQALTEQNVVHVYFAPRGYGPTLVNQDERAMTHFRRRFTLLGQTHDGMAAFDVRRAVQAVRKIDRFQEGKLRLQSQGQMAGITLAAALFEPDIEQLDLYDLPSSLRQGPFFMNAQRYLDTPELVALAAENTRVNLYLDEPAGWNFPRELAQRLGWDAQQFQVDIAPAAR